MSQLDVTFYVPAFNAARYLDEVIPAILAQTHPVQRVLLIDDGSTDGSAEIASKYPVEVVRQPSNLGLAEARNTAIRLADTEVVAAVDSDVVASPHWLETMLGNLADAEVGAVTGCLAERYQATPADLWRALHMKQHYGKARILDPGPFSGSNHVLRKSAWEDVGGFDTSYRTHSEDCDLSRRIGEKGWRIVYEAEARAEHLRQDTVRSIARAKWGWDYWPKLRDGHYRSRARVALGNLRTARWRMTQHVGRPRLLAIDLAMLWLHTRWDWELLDREGVRA